ncbi:unnamed protein product [Alopecurus aequalis]
MATKKTQDGDLPEDMIWEILVRLPPKYLLRCRAVCKDWRRLATDRSLLVDHHSRQPAQPLITVFHENGGATGFSRNCLEAVDLATDKRRILARFVDRVRRGDRHRNLDVFYALRVHGSCDGLLLLSFVLSFVRTFFVCNPVTHQGTLLPLPSHVRAIAGFYAHAASVEYRVLCRRDDDGYKSEYEYDVLTLNWHIRRHSSSASVFGCHWPPVLLHDCLHWPPQRQEGGILVFHTDAETFKSISPPAAAACEHSRLFEMDGELAIFCWQQNAWTSDLWLMENYEEAIWTCKYQIELSPMRASRGFPWDPPIVYREGDMLLEGGWRFVLHYDNRGQLQGYFDCDVSSLNLTPYLLKESLVLHDFLETQQNSAAFLRAVVEFVDEFPVT